MGPIKLKTWVVSALFLFVLGVLADYYFLHILFKEKHGLNGTTNAAGSAAVKQIDPAFNSSLVVAEPSPAPTGTDNFLESLKKCAPEVAAQAVATRSEEHTSELQSH